MPGQELEERTKNIYNDVWANYKEYLADHDMKRYNARSERLAEAYGCRNDIINLILWFAPIVNKLHREHMKRQEKEDYKK